MYEYWLKQTSGKPLFADILWARPENKAGAGKLLVVGGSSNGFTAIQESFAAASQAGAGAVHILLPDALKKTVGAVLPDTGFAPSTPSGSFGRDALNELIIQARWSDTTLLAGDIGRNSETSILLENFVQKHNGLITCTKDVVDYFYAVPELLLDRPGTCIVLTAAQLQKLGTAAKFTTPFLQNMGILLLVQALHDFSLRHQAIIITKELDSIVVAYQGRVSSTKLSEDMAPWCASVAAQASVWWMQNPTRPFEAISSAFIA